VNDGQEKPIKAKYLWVTWKYDSEVDTLKYDDPIEDTSGTTSSTGM
jgi:hypothetical protein